MSCWTLSPLHSWCDGTSNVVINDRIYIRFEWDRGICDMSLVVWRIEIFAIPAGRKSDCAANAPKTELIGKTGRVVAGAGWSTEGLEVLAKAAVTDASGFSCRAAEHWIASEHAESLGIVLELGFRDHGPGLTGLNAVTLLTPSYGGI